MHRHVGFTMVLLSCPYLNHTAALIIESLDIVASDPDEFLGGRHNLDVVTGVNGVPRVRRNKQGSGIHFAMVDVS